MIDSFDGNQLIKNKINSKTDVLAAGKMGMSEYQGILGLIRNNITEYAVELLHVNAGVYPNTAEAFNQFKNIYIEAVKKMNVLGVWIKISNDLYADDIFLNELECTCDRVHTRSLEPFYHEDPWSQALEGKKVLVVSPFQRSIQKQYKKRELIWNNPKVLPEFDLDTLKTPFSAALLDKPVFPTWEDGLNEFKKKIENKKPDFVIVGAGAWSLPIVSFCHDNGIDAIHMGGGTQILFGIKGGRWDNHDVISTFYNEHWVRPAKDERPKNMDRMKIDNGDYW